MNYRYCSGCGHRFDGMSWESARFCTWCGTPLKSGARHGVQAVAFPCPERLRDKHPISAAFPASMDGIGNVIRHHPWLFSAAAVSAGIGGIITGIWLTGLGQGLAIAGCVLLCLAMIAAFSEDGEGAGSLILAGLSLLVAGALIVLIGNILCIAGVITVVAGLGVGLKAGADAAQQKRIESMMKAESLNESVNVLTHSDT